MFQDRLQGCGFDRRVCAEYAEQSRHVRMDHAGAFGHACEAVAAVWGGGEGEGAREELGEGVCGADCTGCVEPGFVC